MNKKHIVSIYFKVGSEFIIKRKFEREKLVKASTQKIIVCKLKNNNVKSGSIDTINGSI